MRTASFFTFIMAYLHIPCIEYSVFIRCFFSLNRYGKSKAVKRLANDAIEPL